MSGIIGVSPDMKSGVIGQFPAGQVITINEITPADTSWVGVDGYTSCNNFEISITKKQTNSKIELICSFNWNGYWQNSSDSHGYTKWVRSAPSAWTSPEFRTYWADELAGETYWNGYWQQTNAFTDTSTSSGVHTYKMYIRASDNTNNVTSYPAYVNIREVTL